MFDLIGNVIGGMIGLLFQFFLWYLIGIVFIWFAFIGFFAVAWHGLSLLFGG